MPPRLPERSASPGARPAICIVTSELVGPFNNGGIGTSMTGLAQTLAAAGFPVTALYTGGRFETAAERAKWRELYAGIGITLVWLADVSPDRVKGPLARCGFATPWHVYRYLREQRFDLIQFNDCMGEGAYCLAARRLGLAFRDTTMFVALHSPSQWVYEVNRTVPGSPLHAAFNHAERLSVQCADLLWGPSSYLIEWARERGFELPDATFVQKYVLPTVPLFDPPAAAPMPADRTRIVPREIVFFGRLEERKGLGTFCQALDLIEDRLAAEGIAVSFLGREGTVAGRPALDYLAERMRHWRFETRVVTSLGQQEALARLASGPVLAVMASPADNSPCTVYEAMALGIPFIAARTGGIPELVDERDHAEALFDAHPQALAARLDAVLRTGIAPARAAEAADGIHRRWISAFESATRWAAPVPPRSAKPLSTIALVDAPAGTDLSATLASLHGAAKIIVIARGAAPDLSAAAAPVVTIDGQRPDALGALSWEAEADTLLFVRGGVVLEPGALAALAQLVECPQVDGLVPAAIGADGRDMVVPPLGSSQSFCFYEGGVPGGCLFVKRAALAALAERLEAIPEAEFLGIPELAIAGGLAIWPFPEPVVRHPGGLVADPFAGSTPERIRAYSQASPTELYYMAAMAAERFARPAGAAPALKAVRARMLDWRLGWLVAIAERTLLRGLIRRLRRRG